MFSAFRMGPRGLCDIVNSIFRSCSIKCRKIGESQHDENTPIILIFQFQLYSVYFRDGMTSH